MVEMHPIVQVRPARATDLDNVKALADANRESLGFVLRPALAEAITRQWLYVAELNNNIVGFVNFRPRRDGWTTIYEICVASNERRRRTGQTLLMAVYNSTMQKAGHGVRLKCPVDSPANLFYAALGLRRMGEEPGKCRTLILWTWEGE